MQVCNDTIMCQYNCYMTFLMWVEIWYVLCFPFVLKAEQFDSKTMHIMRMMEKQSYNAQEGEVYIRFDSMKLWNFLFHPVSQSANETFLFMIYYCSILWCHSSDNYFSSAWCWPTSKCHLLNAFCFESESMIRLKLITLI